jgi:CPA2 family monovalent cation:H+ antiporter-2
MNSLLIFDLLIILASGFIAALFCRFLKLPMLVGYIAVGALVGSGGLKWIGSQHHEIEYLAEAGALLLLFSIGLEFSLKELTRLWRNILIGGSTQMMLVAIPITGLGYAAGLPWQPSLLLGLAIALSSTVLVFKSLAEYGQTTSSGGRSSLGILLFQDIAIVPILLLAPFLAGQASDKSVLNYIFLAVNSTFIIAAIPILRRTLQSRIIPFLHMQRSPELIVLFVLSLLGTLIAITWKAGLPPALGAFACGLVLNGNRLTGQIDALVLPFRETFAAVFFVSLGMLFNPEIIIRTPLFAAGAFLSIVIVKSAAGSFAARLTGLKWKPALGVGIGLSQIGEFAFILVFAGLQTGVILKSHYDYILVFALGSLLLTPILLKTGLKLMANETDSGAFGESPAAQLELEGITSALIVGIGDIGKQLSLHLETRGFFVCAIDLSQVNLYPLSLQGIASITGDARDPAVLERARVKTVQLAIVCVPDDTMAVDIVKSIRSENPGCTLLVRCRYRLTAEELHKLGADIIITEETSTTKALIDMLAEKDII